MTSTATPAHRVLVVDGDPAHLRWLSRITRSLLLDTDARDQLGELDPGGAGHGLLLVNHDALTPVDRAALKELGRHGGAKPRLLFFSRASSGRTFEAFGDLEEFHAFGNLLGRDDVVDADELIVTLQKILRADPFGLEKYFAWGVERVTLELTSSADRARAISAAETYASGLGLNPRLVSQFGSVVDELVTNAFYDAPVDASGKPRYAHYDRRIDVTLEKDEHIRLTFCCDGRTLGISTSDPFGSLRRDQILASLSRCFRKGVDQIDDKEGGAGLGLYVVFNALSQFIVNLQEGVQTEVIGLMDIRSRDAATRAKSLHIFTRS